MGGRAEKADTIHMWAAVCESAQIAVDRTYVPPSSEETSVAQLEVQVLGRSGSSLHSVSIDEPSSQTQLLGSFMGGSMPGALAGAAAARRGSPGRGKDPARRRRCVRRSRPRPLLLVSDGVACQ